MTGIPTPEAVEVMTDAQIDALRVPRPGGLHMVFAGLIATIDALKARALPAPRRYTGGPLEDGVYLVKSPLWPEWETYEAWAGAPGPYIAPANGFLWLIGPIPIPGLPEEEAANG